MIRILLIFSILLICFIVVLPVFADGNEGVKFKPQVGLPGFEAGVEKQVTPITLADFIVNFYTWSIRAIAVLAAVMIMVAGFQWMLAAGSAPQVSQAKDRMMSALIGLILALGAYTLLNFLNPALVRFRELAPETIATKLMTPWCEKYIKEGKVVLAGVLIKTMSQIKGVADARCGHGPWFVLPGDYEKMSTEEKKKARDTAGECMFATCDGEKICLAPGELSMEEVKPSAFICKKPAEVCKAREHLGEGWCARVDEEFEIMDTVFQIKGTYEQLAGCRWDPGGIDNCRYDYLLWPFALNSPPDNFGWERIGCGPVCENKSEGDNRENACGAGNTCPCTDRRRPIHNVDAICVQKSGVCVYWNGDWGKHEVPE